MKNNKLLKKATSRWSTTLSVTYLPALFFCGTYITVCAQPVRQLNTQWAALQQQKNYQAQQQAVNLLNQLSTKYIYDNPDSTLYFANIALRLAQKQQYVAGQITAMNNIGKGYYVRGNYDSSLIISDSALKLSEKRSDSLGMAIALNNIGLIYLAHDDLTTSEREFAKALAIVTRLNDSLQIAKNLFNLGICYDESAKVDSAETYLTNAIRTEPAGSDHHITAMAYNRLGKTEYHGKNYAKAIEYYQKVLGYKEYSDNWETSFACQGLAEVYYNTGKYNEAVTYSLKAFEAAKAMNAKWDAEQALFVLAKSEGGAGDFKDAFKYQVLDQVYKDSLYAEAKQQVENYFKLQAKEAANATLEKENRLIQEKIHLTWLLNIIISAFALTLAVATALLYRSYKAKLKLNNELVIKNKSISHLNEMKDQLFRVVSHDLRGPMASLQQTLQLASENAFNAQQQKFIIENLNHQVTLSTQMLNNLLTWAETQRGGIAADIKTIEPGLIITEIIAVFELIACRKNVKVDYEGAGAQPLKADENQFRIIVQNLLSNAVKFTPSGGSVFVFFSAGQGNVAINIQDTGIGMSKEKQEQLFKNFGASITSFGTDKEKGTGIGLMIVKEFAAQNKATLSVTSETGKGTAFTVSFPAA